MCPGYGRRINTLGVWMMALGISIGWSAITHASPDTSQHVDVFNLPPASRLDSYGPRPFGVPELTREQIVRYGLENPLVKAADAQIEAMQSLLLKAKFAWIPTITTRTAIAPGVHIECEDMVLQLAEPTTSTGEKQLDFQYCRPPGGQSIDTIQGYFNQLSRAGVTIRFDFEFFIPLYTFGKIKHSKQMAGVAVALAELNKERIRQETVLRVYQAYETLLLARESIALLQEAWQIIGDARIIIEKDLGEGENANEEDINLDRDPADLFRLELGELELEQRMRSARRIESVALATLWAIAGDAAPPGFDIAQKHFVVDSLEDGLRDVSYYQQLSLRQRPEANMASAQAELRKAAEQLARAQFLPNLGIAVAGQFAYTSAADRSLHQELYYYERYNYNRILISLALAWNLDFHNYAFALKRARAERKEAEYQRDAAMRLLGLEVEQAYRELQEATAAIKLTKRASDTAKRLVIDQKVKETVGGGDFAKLETALTQWAEWRFKYFDAIQSHNTALAKLSRAVGKPLTKPTAIPAE